MKPVPQNESLLLLQPIEILRIIIEYAVSASSKEKLNTLLSLYGTSKTLRIETQDKLTEMVKDLVLANDPLFFEAIKKAPTIFLGSLEFNDCSGNEFNNSLFEYFVWSMNLYAFKAVINFLPVRCADQVLNQVKKAPKFDFKGYLEALADFDANHEKNNVDELYQIFLQIKEYQEVLPKNIRAEICRAYDVNDKNYSDLELQQPKRNFSKIKDYPSTLNVEIVTPSYDEIFNWDENLENDVGDSNFIISIVTEQFEKDNALMDTQHALGYIINLIEEDAEEDETEESGDKKSKSYILSEDDTDNVNFNRLIEYLVQFLKIVKKEMVKDLKKLAAEYKAYQQEQALAEQIYQAVYENTYEDNIDILKELIETLNDNQSVLNQANSVSGYSPLMLAIHNENFEIVELLLKSGANPNIISTTDDFTNYTPLMLAIDNESLDIVNLLLKHGANPNLISNGKNILMYALERFKDDSIKAIQLLCLYGAKFPAISLNAGKDQTFFEALCKFDNMTILMEWMKKKKFDHQYFNDNFKSFLQIAIQFNAPQIISYLKEQYFEEYKVNYSYDGTLANNVTLYSNKKHGRSNPEHTTDTRPDKIRRLN